MDHHNEEYHITRFELGKAYIELEDPKLAISHLKLSFEYFQKDIRNKYYGSVCYYIGFAYFSSEDFVIADEYFSLLTENQSLHNDHIAHGYYGKLFIAKAKRQAEDMISHAGKLMEMIPNFYDRETITYFTVLAYQYQNRPQEYEKALEFFMREYPSGKYSDMYADLQEYEFKTIDI